MGILIRYFFAISELCTLKVFQTAPFCTKMAINGLKVTLNATKMIVFVTFSTAMPGCSARHESNEVQLLPPALRGIPGWKPG